MVSITTRERHLDNEIENVVEKLGDIQKEKILKLVDGYKALIGELIGEEQLDLFED